MALKAVITVKIKAKTYKNPKLYLPANFPRMKIQMIGITSIIVCKEPGRTKNIQNVLKANKSPITNILYKFCLLNLTAKSILGNLKLKRSPYPKAMA
ncbi:hypothetical protein [Algoriphagus ratkowskyi]|uniref:hypothetical protein n=1 Tax=Algoriphagus ratkowskyi TaxID=57028 RepID=UPI00196B8B77|nr:hypothetical protein [Algoriphagus ratkowskyi]